MAIPPIISNFPLFRIFRADRGDGKARQDSSAAPQSGDTVEISAAARKKLEEAQALSAQDLGRIRKVTASIKHFLEQNPASLGLDPAFE